MTSLFSRRPAQFRRQLAGMEHCQNPLCEHLLVWLWVCVKRDGDGHSVRCRAGGGGCGRYKVASLLYTRWRRHRC